MRVNNDVDLKARLVEQLSAQLSCEPEYRSEAPDESKHSDTTTRAAIVNDFRPGESAPRTGGDPSPAVAALPKYSRRVVSGSACVPTKTARRCHFLDSSAIGKRRLISERSMQSKGR